jgi:hypothetical protein
MQKRGCEDKKPDFQKWAVFTDYMLRLDKREPRRVAEVIRWSQKNDFWKKNIRSTKKLRAQWATLVDDMKTEKEKADPNSKVILCSECLNGYNSALHSECPHCAERNGEDGPGRLQLAL